MDTPMIDFDHHTEQYKEHGLDQLAAVREVSPVARSPHHGGFVVVSNHALATEVALDPSLYSSRHELDGSPYEGANLPGTAYVFMPGELDPPDHTNFRKLVNPFFTRDAAQRHEQSVRHWTTIAIDAVIESGSIDIVEDFTSVVSALFTCQLVGLPIDSWKSWGPAVHERSYLPPSSPRYDEAAKAFARAVESVLKLTYERRQDPQDDLLSSVAQATLDGRLLTEVELRSVCTSFLVGGFDTTASHVTGMLGHLGRHPKLRAQLINTPELMPSAVEEYLRYLTPAQGLARTVTGPATLGGCPLHEHDRVFMSYAAANRDPAQFDRPEEIVLDRSPNRHLAFGAGIHRCIGRHFARMEAAVMVGEFLRRIPNFEIDEDATERFPSVGIINGWIRMRASFEPGEREQQEDLP